MSAGMNGWRLVLRSLAQYRRTHLGVAGGAAIATAVLVGALGVGDSLERSLTEQALRRIGEVRLAMDTGERTFTAPLADALTAALAEPGAPSAAALHVRGLASADGGRRRVPDVHVHGVGDDFWAVGGHGPVALGDGRAAVNETLARALAVGAGDDVLLRFAAPSALPRDVPLGGDAADTLTLRVTVEHVLGAGELGDFDLSGNPEAPRNLFVPLATLERAAHLVGRRNVVLAASPSAAEAAAPGRASAADAPIEPPALRTSWRLEDGGARLRRLGDDGPWDLSSERVFLSAPLVRAALAAAPARTALTYWVDAIEAPNGRVARYAMVTAYDPGAPAAAPPAPVPPDLADDQIVVTRWLADHLAVGAGDTLTLRYWVFGLNRQLTRASARFTVARVVDTAGVGGDRALMPELPGLTDVESALDWDPAPELEVHPALLTDAERDFWRDHRGAPKAFVSASWARGAGGWRTPYGDVTSVRLDGGLDEVTLRERIRAQLAPAELGLGFQPVREQALRAVGGGVASYFGYLFASLSAFVIVAALVLVVLLFAFQVEARSTEIGTLRAVGIPARRIRGWLLEEGAVVAAGGCALGIPAGWLYVWLMLGALDGRWAGAVAGTPVSFHVNAATPLAGAAAVLAASAAAMAWVLARRTRHEPRALLSARFGVAEAGRWSRRAALGAAAGAAVLALAFAAAGARASAEGATELFFGAGACMLIAAGSAAAGYLTPASARGRALAEVSFARLGQLGARRRAGRSLAAIGMLASGTFLVISVNAFRLGGAERVSAGTGGFALFARTSLPVATDLATPTGLAALGLERLRDVRILGFRLGEGDEASCRNLARPRRPPLLGADAAAMAARAPFRFSAAIEPGAAPWTLLTRPDEPDVVPAIADEAVAKWVLGLGLGDTLEYVDEAGRPFRVRIAAMLSSSILQGYLVVDARAFAARFPSVAGHRVFLIDAPAARTDDVARALADSALADHGLTITSTAERLAAFDAVQNTYLSIFTAVGGLGLVLGCAGLGVVVLRNVLERRGELAAMRAIGFSRRRLGRLLLVEHGLLLAWGVGAGVASAAVAIGPALAQRDAVPLALVAWTSLAVIANGALWTVVAARLALAGELLEALRHE